MAVILSTIMMVLDKLFASFFVAKAALPAQSEDHASISPAAAAEAQPYNIICFLIAF